MIVIIVFVVVIVIDGLVCMVTYLLFFFFQICAGLKSAYKPDELKGKKVVVLCNLKAAKLRGELSEV